MLVWGRVVEPQDNMKLFFNRTLTNPLQYAAQLGFRSIVEFQLHCDLVITRVHNEFVSSQLGEPQQ